MTYSARTRLADAHIAAVKTRLRERGWQVEDYGQGLLRENARRILHGDPYAQHRWLPDLLAYQPARGDRVLVDGKASNGSNYVVEKSSLSALVEHERVALMPLWIVFHDYRAIRARDLEAATDDPWLCRTGPQGAGRGGSGTPYWIFDRGKMRKPTSGLNEVFGPPR